jgi:hypothetical protein
MLQSKISLPEPPNVRAPSEIGQVERSLGNKYQNGTIFCILNFVDVHTRSLHPCLLRIDNKQVSLTVISKITIPNGPLIMGGGVFPIYFEPKEKPKP